MGRQRKNTAESVKGMRIA